MFFVRRFWGNKKSWASALGPSFLINMIIFYQVDKKLSHNQMIWLKKIEAEKITAIWLK